MPASARKAVLEAEDLYAECIYKRVRPQEHAISTADPARWLDEALGARLYPKQVDMAQAIAEHTQVSTVGCNSCVAPETRLMNAATGEQVPIADVVVGMPVWSVMDRRIVQAYVDQPFIKGTADLYEVCLSDGSAFECTLNHRLLTPAGWQRLASLGVGRQVAVLCSEDVLVHSVSPCTPDLPYEDVLAEGSSPWPFVSAQCGRHGQPNCARQTGAFSQLSPVCASCQARLSHEYEYHWRVEAQDSHQRYCWDSRLCGGQPQTAVDNAQFAFQQLDDVLGHTLPLWRRDDLVGGLGYSPAYPQCARHATNEIAQGQAPSYGEVGCPDVLGSSECVEGAILVAQIATHFLDARSHVEMVPVGGCVLPPVQSFADLPARVTRYSYQSSLSNYNQIWGAIASIRYVGCRQFYDVHVPGTNNYLAEGVFHHNSGKDHTAARLALWWIKRWQVHGEPAKVVITAPTHRQIQQVIWQELRTAYLNARQSLGGTIYEQPLLRWDEQSFITGVSTDRPYQLQGFHSSHLMVIVSEAHGVEQPHMDALWRLNPNCLLMTGNPISEAGEFYDSHHGKAHLWHTITINAFDTPNVIEGHEVVPGLVTREDIERHARNWGEDSPLYRMTVLGEWVEGMGSLVVVPLSWALRAEQATYEPGPVEVVACDPAWYGADSTVIYSRRGRVARLLWKVHGFDLMQTAGWLKGYHDAHKHAQIVVDATGIGAGIVSRLREQGVGVIAFQGGAAASSSGSFVNAIAECYWRMREAYARGLDVDETPDLRSQVSSRKYTIQSDKRIQLESKEQMRKAGRKSPDSADALAMSFYLDWQIDGTRLTAGSDVETTHDEDERPSAAVVGRGTDLSPWSGSRWSKLRGGRR